MGRLEIFGIEGIPQITRGDDLAGIIADAATRSASTSPDNAFLSCYVLVVASKIVSNDEGRLEPIDADDPLSHKPLVER
jgi:coenzyme F420-0:L-glutamate ligase/coenzyme F420-1:gamma-L-glutamate ligase